jgi:hypothetical protein
MVLCMGGLHAVFCNLAVGGSFTVGAGTRSLNKKNEKGNNETKGEKVKMG